MTLVDVQRLTADESGWYGTAVAYSGSNVLLPSLLFVFAFVFVLFCFVFNLTKVCEVVLVPEGGDDPW